ncbi:MAG: UDP-N-acetylmuramoyl-L-alanine--D-glutamate ligase [Patescibacteria group bacterium]|nr:UDP-N-acetylmuramoyl-L-alanine--D-glutamate ligase [Patescibacteria group bacterium]
MNNKKIALLGFGSENVEFLRWFVRHKVDCKITICDQQKDIKKKYKEFDLPNIFWQTGINYDKSLENFDIISRIAGYPLFARRLKKARREGVEISSPTKLFFEYCPTKNIIGVTGTKGKGTTTALIMAILKIAKKTVFWGGNIGIPMFSFIDKLKKDDWVVLELSSFQLEDLKTSPHISVLTNLQREHLRPADPKNPNYHKTYADYILAKFNIFKFQKKKDYAIINQKTNELSSKIKQNKFDLGSGKKIYFDKIDYSSHLAGEHNQENVAAATAVARLLGIKNSTIKKAVKNFQGLEHRLEFIGEERGIKYYEDSFATTPESAIIALKSFDSPIILLAGGPDKGANFNKLAKEITRRVKFLILFRGEGSKRIKKELLRINYPSTNIYSAGSMKEAFGQVKKNIKTGDIVLLSPACASFGIFKNYKERGNKFKGELRKI